MKPERLDPGDDVDDRRTGLPGLRSWRAVYWFVGAVVIVWIALLTLLSRWFA